MLDSWEKEITITIITIITITITVAITVTITVTTIITVLFTRADDQRGFSDEVLDSWEEEEENTNLFNFRWTTNKRQIQNRVR